MFIFPFWFFINKKGGFRVPQSDLDKSKKMFDDFKRDVSILENELRKPEPSIGKILYEGDLGPYCPKCGSSLKKVFLFFRSKHCIQWRCSNYYENYKS